MEEAIKNLKRWIGNNYSNAPNTSLMLQIIEFYVEPLSAWHALCKKIGKLELSYIAQSACLRCVPMLLF